MSFLPLPPPEHSCHAEQSPYDPWVSRKHENVMLSAAKHPDALEPLRYAQGDTRRYFHLSEESMRRPTTERCLVPRHDSQSLLSLAPLPLCVANLGRAALMAALILVLSVLFATAALAQGPSDGGDEAVSDPAPAAHSAGPVAGDPTGISFIENLRARSYGGGSIERLRVIEDNDDFTRYAIRYPSDDITIAGFMDVPKNVSPPYPAIVVAHGFVWQNAYTLMPYSAPYADALARAGYLVVHPNYRNYGASGEGPNPMRSGYAIDVLNLVAILKTTPDVRSDAIGLFGHSMGGEVALRVLVTTSDVRAAVLYGSMSADSWENWNLINTKWAGGWFLFDGPFSPWRDREAFRLSSPSSFLDYVTAPVQIHHGTADDTAPVRWATSLAAALREHGKDVELYTYPGAGHSFGIGGAAHNTMMARSIAFFDSQLKAGR